MIESRVEDDLQAEVKKFPKCAKLLKILLADMEITSLLDAGNRISISRMGFNDHGKVHSKIVSLNSLKIYSLLEKKGINGNVMKEEIGDEEDVRVVLLLGAFLHDLGMCISRESHDILGVIVGRHIIFRLLDEIYEKDIQKISFLESIVMEEILCHLGGYKATSVEAKVVATSDGTDMTKGRARIPYKIAHPDIHQFSALAVEKVSILPGKKKPVIIFIEMNDTAGIFQVEHQLLQKINDVGAQEFVEILVKLQDGREVSYL